MSWNYFPRHASGGSRNYIASQHERLLYAPTRTFSSSRTVTLSYGQVLFTIAPEKRRSRITSVRDVSGAPLFEYTFEPHWFKQDTFSAYSPFGAFHGYGSSLLWEMNRKEHSATHKWNVISFPIGSPLNNFGGLVYKQRYRGRIGGELLRGSVVVARVDRTGMWSNKYIIEVMPGIDMAMVVGIVAAVEDKVCHDDVAT